MKILDKEEYVESSLSTLRRNYLFYISLAGAPFIMVLSALDYFAIPWLFHRFLMYRIVTTAIMTPLILFYIASKKRYFYTTATAATILVLIMVEAMILSTGGHQSTYYVGMIILFMFSFAFLPLRPVVSFIYTALIYLAYLVPILLLDSITNVRVFLNNAIFLFVILCAGFIWKCFHYDLIRKKLGLEYDLSLEKDQFKDKAAIKEQWYSSLFNTSNEGILILDEDGRIIDLNPKACEIYGFENNELIDMKYDLLKADEEKIFMENRRKKILAGESMMFETRCYRKDGTVVDVEINAKSVSVGGKTYLQKFIRDITQRKQMDEKLFHAEKMETIGRLAGGIAHNFNNILGTILGYASSIMEIGSVDEESRKKLGAIEQSTRKAGIIISKLANFTVGDSHFPTSLNLNDVVKESIRLFEGLILKKKVAVSTNLGKIRPIRGDQDKLEQVLLNLLINAKDAIEHGGTITVITREEEISDESPCIVNVPPGSYVLLKVIDNGCGIPKEVINKIFDPFFTTKGKGKGNGLGLSSVYGIVKEHKGHIAVKSEVGKGTTFDVYLPVSQKEEIAPKRDTILVIDDDSDVLEMIKSILESYNYSTIAVDNSLTALDIFKKHSQKIHLVITDVAMPLMGGHEVAKAIKSIRQDTKIIVISGYHDQPPVEEKDEYLSKPFESASLIAAVKRLTTRAN